MIHNKTSIAEFLKDLPCHAEENFSLFNTENGIRTSLKRPSVYLPTDDSPTDQIIVTEKKSILLRYLHQQWEKKNPVKKRDSTSNPNAGNNNNNNNNSNSTSGENPDGSTARKRPRLDPNAHPASQHHHQHHQHQQSHRDNN